MVIADDRSPDNTGEVVQSYANTDSRIRLVRLQQNVGAAMARNTSLDAARGRYVAFLDSDDVWMPESYGFSWNSCNK